MRKYDHIEEIAKSGFDTIVEVEKFNPYHDAKGRFSSADSATSFTYAPGKSKAHDMAIAREKERHAKQIENPTNDPETIAGVKRGPAMTHEQADEGKANPRYNDADKAYERFSEANRKLTDAVRNGASDEEKERLSKELKKSQEEYNRALEQTRQYRDNCQSCVVAYEARRRGYDVEAKPRTKLNPDQERLAKDPGVAYNDPSAGFAKAKVLTNPPNINTSKKMTQWLEENVQEGGRYEFAHGWKGTSGHDGHIIVAEKVGGSMRLFDPQSGKTYTGDNYTAYMKRIKGTYNNGYSTKGRLELIRVDNLQLSASMTNSVLKGAGR